MKSSALLALPFLLAAAACDRGPREVEVILAQEIDDQDGKDIRFATFGFSSTFDEDDEIAIFRMILIASDNPDLCGTLSNDPAALDALKSGQLAGTFALAEIEAFGVEEITPDLTIKGDIETGDLVDLRFLVSDGTDFDVEAVDLDQEGQLDVLAFDGQELKANLFVTLNQEQSAGLLFGGGNDSINVDMSVQILRAPLCPALSF